MTQNKYKRKLTAILSADVVGYSRLMGDDEEFTIQTLNSHRDLMTALIEQYSGRVVDAVGDNLLAEFTSAADAVQCAVAVQMKLKKKNKNFSDSRKMHFRIGINIGDIVHEKNRIYGDGVNIAARIESLSDPGGISISRNIYNHIKKQLDFDYDYMGEHSVKNISDPVRVYKVLMDPEDAGKRIKEKSDPPVKKSQFKKWFRVIVSIILILSAVLAGVYWKYIYLPAPADIDPDGKIEFKLPEGPSIAVLPFVNMSKDPEQEYLCDGITENLIATLAQTKRFIVIARNSTFAYKNKSMNVQQIGQELGARYLIEGSIQKLDDRYRFVVQLIDAETDAHIWAERYDRESNDIFNLQDEITLEILKAVGIKLTTPWLEESVMVGINDINSFIKFAKVMVYFQNPTKKGYTSALKNVKEIIALNPEHPKRYDLLAGIYISGIFFDPEESPTKRMFLATEAVKKSLSLDENNYSVHFNLGWIFLFKKEYDKAIASIKKSLELNPLNADAYHAMGYVLNYSDRHLEALESMTTAIRLNPVTPSNYLYTMGRSYVELKQYKKAIEILNTCLKHQPDYWGAYVSLAYTYGLSGQEEKAKTAVKELLILVPDYSITKMKNNSLIKNQDQQDRWAAILQKAGLPE